MSFFQLLAYVPLHRVSYKQKVLHVRKSNIRVLLMLYVKVERIFTRDVTCTIQFLKNEWVRYIATGEGGQGGHAPPPPSPTSVSKPNKVQQFQFQTSGILLFMGFRNYMDQKSHDFYRVCNNFWTISGAFHFF